LLMKIRKLDPEGVWTHDAYVYKLVDLLEYLKKSSILWSY